MKFQKSPKKNKISKNRVSGLRITERRYASKIISAIKVMLIFAVLGVCTYVMLFSSFFSIKNIRVAGAEKFVNSEDVNLMASSNVLGKNIFLLRESNLSERLKENLLGAKDFYIKKVYPSSLEITIYEREPIAIIYNSSDEQYFVDEAGYILGYADPSEENLPRIMYEKDIRIGLFIDENMVPLYLELTKVFYNQDVKVSSMSFSPKHINVYIKDGPEILIGNEKDKEQAIKTVKELLKESTLESKEIRRIDIRYDKVIVLFK